MVPNGLVKGGRYLARHEERQRILEVARPGGTKERCSIQYEIRAWA